MSNRQQLANAIRFLSMDAVQSQIRSPGCTDGNGGYL